METHQGDGAQGLSEAERHDLVFIRTVTLPWRESSKVYLPWSLAVCSNLYLSTPTRSRCFCKFSRSSTPNAKCRGTDGAEDLGACCSLGISQGI